MTKLNLTANGKPQELILAYLQENASNDLAEKINNGVYIVKDGKRLLSKKDLTGFMQYATDEAKKLADKNARSACVEDNVVYGWAIHYFEENNIEGKLFNEDGTEYKPATTPVNKASTIKAIEPKIEKEKLTSLFDMITATENKTVTKLDAGLVEDNYDDYGDLQESNKETDTESQIKLQPFYVKYKELKERYPNHVVIIRLGDFYEAFEDDATILSNQLDLTITSRDVGLERRIPVIGFPYHATEKYITKIRNYNNVVISEFNDKTVTLSKLVTVDGQHIDEITGEVITQTNDKTNTPVATKSSTTAETEFISYLQNLLDGKMIIA